MPPELRGRPFALLRTERQRRMVVAVNRAAAAAGIAPGHTLGDARALEPALEVAEATPEADSALLGRIADWARRYSPWTAADEPDGVVIDITGCAHLFANHLWEGEAALAADLTGRLRAAGFSARAAIADTPAACAAWLSRAEALAADACRAGADVEGLPARLAILGRPEPERVSAATRALQNRLSGPLGEDASLWWTRGAGRVAPSLLSCSGLPAGPRLTAFLDGAWSRWGWENAEER